MRWTLPWQRWSSPQVVCRSVLVVVIAFGCGHDRDDTPPPSDCRAVAAAMRSRNPTLDDVATKQIEKHCADDAWSTAARKCVTSAAPDRCAAELTADQRERLSIAMGLSREPTADEIAERLRKLAGFKDAVCACKDAACATRVNDELSRFTMDVAKSGIARPKLSGHDQKRVGELFEQAMACMKTVMESSAAPTDAQRYVARNSAFKDRLCACKDISCAKAVAAELTKWSEEFLAHPNDPSTMSQEDQARLDVIERDIGACMSSLRTGRR
jgi:hypothetical protein